MNIPPVASPCQSQLTDIVGLRACGIFPAGREPSIRTLREWTRLRRIPHHRVGHFVYYDPAEVAVHIRIRAQGLRLIDHYRSAFGAFLFGDAGFFKTRAKYDLSPLAREGRASLGCDDFAGEIDWVRLTALTLRSEFTPASRSIHESDDLFSVFERTKQTLEPTALVSATFRVKFTAAQRPRSFSIRSSCKVRQARDTDAFLLEAWLRARGFIAAESGVAVAA